MVTRSIDLIQFLNYGTLHCWPKYYEHPAFSGIWLVFVIFKLILSNKGAHNAKGTLVLTKNVAFSQLCILKFNLSCCGMNLSRQSQICTHQFKRACEGTLEGWNELSWTYLLRLLEGMPRICLAVIKATGGYFVESWIWIYSIYLLENNFAHF